MSKKKLLLFDTNSIIHRAFHALPPLKDKEGNPSGAVYGALTTFFRLLDEFSPDMVVMAFDSPGKTFRHSDFKNYKANRPDCPDELVMQIIKVKEVFEKMGIAVLSEVGLEADDIVGAVSSFFKGDYEIVVVTGDADILQLVGNGVKVYTFKRGIKESVLYDREKVKEKYAGLGPEKIVDIKALQGDSSDNIPGVEGVGEKTALRLISQFNSLEELYQKLEEGSTDISEKIKEKLLKDKEKAFLSKKLATINTSIFDSSKVNNFSPLPNEGRMIRVIEGLGFPSLLKRLANDGKNDKNSNGYGDYKKYDKERSNLTFNF